MPDEPDRADSPDAPDLTNFVRDAGAGVVPPSFDDLMVAHRRRRRVVAIGGAAAAVTILAVGFTGIQAVYDDQAAPIPPANPTATAPAPTPTTDRAEEPEKSPIDPRDLTAEQVVDASGSKLMSLTLSPSQPANRVSVWMACAGGACHRPAYALAVTSDGFATRHLVSVDASQAPAVYPLDSTTFYLAVYDRAGNREETILEADGDRREIEFRDSEPTSLLSGEVLVQHGESQPGGTETLSYFGLDPVTGVAHPIPVPDGNHSRLIQSPNGILYGVSDVIGETASRMILWSDDGGGTWESRRITTGREVVVSPLPSWEPGVMALSEGALNTVVPLERLHRSADGGATWEVIEQPFTETPYPDWLLVQPDGSLVAGIASWSVDRVSRPGEQPWGLYASDGADWSALRLVQDFPQPADAEVLGGSVPLAGFQPGYGDRRTTLWIYDAWGSRAYESGPGIDTWRETPAR